MSTNPPAQDVSTNPSINDEEQLRQQLREAMQYIKSREPLESTYKHLILDAVVTPRRPVLPNDKTYKKIGSGLRQCVERYLEKNQGKNPFDAIGSRKPMEDEKLRAALTLREPKDHEQQALLEATLASMPKRYGMDERSRRMYLEAVALGLQAKEKKPLPKNRNSPPSAMQKTQLAMEQATLERQRAQASALEAARRKREEEDRARREADLERQRNRADTPQQALQKLYYPVFKKLWDMEFAQLGGINPFRIVIDRDNCASVGAPDYFTVIEKPMNLTWIQQKVEDMEYETFGAFCTDVELMLSNAIKYNSDPSNPYRIAAEEMKKRYMKLVKRVVSTVQQKQQQTQKT